VLQLIFVVIDVHFVHFLVKITVYEVTSLSEFVECLLCRNS